MSKKLVKIGVFGSITIAICCFTPFLVWILISVGLTAVIAYLDYILLPLLAIFLIILILGLIRYRKK